MKGAERSTDVQHLIYDELHDASNWELFLLSHDLFQFAQGADIYIYVMTATTETPVFAAILNAVARTLPGRDIFPIYMPGGAETMASEIPSAFLPNKFKDSP